MMRLFSIIMGICVFYLQGCAAQEEPKTMRADMPSVSQSAEQSKTYQVFEETITTNQDTSNSERDEYHPYIIYEDEGIDKNAIHASKNIEFADDPQDPSISNTSNDSSNDLLADITDNKAQEPSNRQNHLIVQQNTNQPIRSAHASSTHEFKDNFVSHKFGNMEECTEVIIKHMLKSPIFANHTPSALVLGKITNKTGDDTLPVGQIERVLQSTVSQVNFIKIIDTNVEKSTSKYDYTTNILVQNAENSKKKGKYTIRVQLLNYYGELVGQWSAQTS